MKRTSIPAETDGVLRRSARIKKIVNAENTPSNNNGDTQEDCSGREKLKRGRKRKYVPKEEVVHVSVVQAKRARRGHTGPDDPQPGTSTETNDTSAVTNDDHVECPVCLEAFPTPLLYGGRTGCTHKFCGQCIETYVERRRAMGAQVFPCMYLDCPEKLSRAVLRKVLPGWGKGKQSRETEPLTVTNDEEPTDETFRNFIDNKMAEAVIRVCPKCGTRFVKESGCNRMTCSGCNTIICYACGKDVTRARRHFSNRRSCYKLIVVDALHKRDIQQIIPKAKREFLERNPQADREMVETFDPLKTWEAPAPPRTYPTHTRFNDLPPVPRQDYGVPMVPIDTRPMPSFFNNLPLQILQTDPPVTQASRTPRPLPEPPASQGSIQSRPAQMGHLSAVVSEETNNTSAVTRDDHFECPVCLEEFPMSLLYECRTGGTHKFCRQCIEIYVERRRTWGAKVFPCLYPGCPEKLGHAVIKKVLLARGKGRQGWEVEPLAIDGEPTNETFRNFMDNKIAEAVIRVCPKCETRFVKESGCNSISCGGCNIIICYACGKDVTEVCGHFSSPKHSCNKVIRVADIHKRDIQQIIPKAKREFLERYPQADREMVEMFDPLKTWEAPAPPRTYPTHTRFNDLPHVPRQDYGVPMVPIDTRPMPSFFNSLPPPILQNDPPATQASPTPRPQPEPPASQGSIQTRPVHTYFNDPPPQERPHPYPLPSPIPPETRAMHTHDTGPVPTLSTESQCPTVLNFDTFENRPLGDSHNVSRPQPAGSQGTVETRPKQSHLQTTLPVPRLQTETPQHQAAFWNNTYFNYSSPVPEPRPDPPATEITPGIGTVQTQILFLPRTHTDPPGLQAALETRPTHTYFDEPPSVGRPSNEPPQIPVPLEAEPAHTYFNL